MRLSKFERGELHPNTQALVACLLVFVLSGWVWLVPIIVLLSVALVREVRVLQEIRDWKEYWREKEEKESCTS